MSYKVGYTTGVFDLFHVGHLNLLRRASERCEKLIVGVSTDDLVLSYKGNRPWVSFEERSAIVGSIRYVSEVVPQASMDKFRAWEALHFEALFHGDDWKGTPMYLDLESRLSAVGVAIIYFPYTHGTSSSKLRDALRVPRPTVERAFLGQSGTHEA